MATQRELLVLVALITSIYPAVTVILARSVLRERMGIQQVIGLGLAVTIVILIASG